MTNLPTDAGEVFPIRIKEGVSVVGEPFQPNGNTQGSILQGSGLYASPTAGSIQTAVILTQGASLSRVIIRSQGGIGLIAEGVNGSVANALFTNNKTALLLISSHAAVSNNAITGNETGIESRLGDTSRIDQNIISGNGAGTVGVRISDAAPALRRNQITGNLNGGVVAEAGANPDLGGGGQSDGGNTLSCNGAGDLINQTAGTLFARNNFWDHFPPTTATTLDLGADAVSTNGGTIDSFGAGTVTPSCG